MISKSRIITDNNQDYKYSFLLAWFRFLKYDELQKTNNLEAFDAAKQSGMVKSQSEWNKAVLDYNENNIKSALCITMNNTYRDYCLNNAECFLTYIDDISHWLDILEDTEIKLENSLEDFFNNVSKKYKFDLKL